MAILCRPPAGSDQAARSTVRRTQLVIVAGRLQARLSVCTLTQKPAGLLTQGARRLPATHSRQETCSALQAALSTRSYDRPKVVTAARRPCSHLKRLGAKAPQLTSVIWFSVMQSRSFQTQPKGLPSTLPKTSCSLSHFQSLMAEHKQSPREPTCSARCNAHTAAVPNSTCQTAAPQLLPKPLSQPRSSPMSVS